VVTEAPHYKTSPDQDTDLTVQGPICWLVHTVLSTTFDLCGHFVQRGTLSTEYWVYEVGSRTAWQVWLFVQVYFSVKVN
jgi:hypothetical protein